MAESKGKKKRAKPSYSKSAVRALILFAVFLAVTCGAVMGAVILLPVDVPVSEPANTPGNLMYGGKLAFGDDRVFYTDSTGVYSFANSTPDKQATVSDKPADQLFYMNGKVYYTQDGTLYSAFFDGGLKTEVFSGFDEIQLAGGWLYYMKEGTLHKRKLDGTRDAGLGLRPKQYYVLSQMIYFLEEDGKIYHARTDGTGRALFADVQADRFMINGNFLFYSNGTEIRSLSMADRKTGEKLADAEVFQVNGASFYYLRDGGLYFRKLGSAASSSEAMASGAGSGGDNSKEKKAVDKKLTDTDADTLYLAGEYVYFGKANGAISRIRPDGTELKEISGSTK